MCTPPHDPLTDQALRLLAELREHGDEALLEEPPEDVLAGGYVSALALERAQRRLRQRAAALAADGTPGTASPSELSRVAQLELRLAAQERELRQLLGTFRARKRAAAQETKPRRSA